MKKVKTANGNLIDMSAIARQNETTVAVGNVKMNARGDILDQNNKVMVPVEQLSRFQHTISSPKEEIKMSDTESITKAESVKKAKVSKKNPKEINRTIKTDVSGNKIIEIEYDDGNIKIIKEENDENHNPN